MTYLTLPYEKLTAIGTLAQQKKTIGVGGFTYSKNEMFQISFQLCSTKLAQNGRNFWMLSMSAMSWKSGKCQRKPFTINMSGKCLGNLVLFALLGKSDPFH